MYTRKLLTAITVTTLVLVLILQVSHVECKGGRGGGGGGRGGGSRGGSRSGGRAGGGGGISGGGLSGASIGTTLGIVFGSIAFFILLTVGIVCCCHILDRRKKKAEARALSENILGRRQRIFPPLAATNRNAWNKSLNREMPSGRFNPTHSSGKGHQGRNDGFILNDPPPHYEDIHKTGSNGAVQRGQVASWDMRSSYNNGVFPLRMGSVPSHKSSYSNNASSEKISSVPYGLGNQRVCYLPSAKNNQYRATHPRPMQPFDYSQKVLYI